MNIPFGYEPTEAEKYAKRVRIAKRKAQTLSKRMEMFFADLKGLKAKDFEAVRLEAMNFLTQQKTK